ncbi:tRNA (guanosine(37)-N1)-methyltransferase TrmD [candidate division KSB1 bacterium]|nr:tRNA (guanosine(37)-N1)-methyltransferase TrmD [candidate division KSB1 bacterium]
MRVFIVTAFPQLLSSPLNESILKRAQKKKLVEIKMVDLRDFTEDRHKQIDDYPYGGGPGMILKPEPFFKAVEHIKTTENLTDPAIILMTPQGETFNQGKAKQLAQSTEIVFLCGHYKGVDERVRENLATEEISIGDYILTGGELTAMVVVDSVVRLLPGVIGDFESAETDSFQQSVLDWPHYTRPENFQGMRVPEVLLSGHHGEIEKWRRKKALERTQEQRADLLIKN